MTKIFYGDWRVVIAQLNADFSQQVVIRGASSGSGVYSGVPGTIVTVSGQEWTLTAEWNNNVDSGWQPSQLQEYVAYTLQEGLSITLNIDDGLADGDYNDMILVCQSLDSAVNPLLPAANPYDFTIMESMLYDPSALDPTEEPAGAKDIFLPFVSND